MDKSICRRPFYPIFDTKDRLKICRFESESGILRLYFQNRLNHIIYGAHVAEVFGLQFAAGFAFDVVDKVDGVDAVDFQILVEVGLGFDALGFDFKQVDQCIGQKGAYFLFGHIASPLCLTAFDEFCQCFDVGEVVARVVVFAVDLKAKGFFALRKPSDTDFNLSVPACACAFGENQQTLPAFEHGVDFFQHFHAFVVGNVAGSDDLALHAGIVQQVFFDRHVRV